VEDAFHFQSTVFRCRAWSLVAKAEAPSESVSYRSFIALCRELSVWMLMDFRLGLWEVDLIPVWLPLLQLLHRHHRKPVLRSRWCV
jgi:hypothetical protein